MYWSSLKITHPLGNWQFAAVLAALGGIYFMFTDAKVLTTEQGIFISLEPMFWVGLVTYIVSTLGFIYLKIAPRFKSMPAGAENMERLRVFVSNYPEIAKELSLDSLLRKGATFGQLKKVQKDANRKLVQVASKTLIRRGDQ